MELQLIKSKIHIIRNSKVIHNRGLAELYSAETKVPKQAVRRNINRFPEDFMSVLYKKVNEKR